MRLSIPTALLSILPIFAAVVFASQDPEIAHWSALASRSKDGIIKLDATSYDELVAGDREYSVTVVLTALGPQFKCQPCHDFDPAYRQVASSWKRQPADVRDRHFFAQLDFIEGQAIYQRLGLSSAPTVQFHPAQAGPNRGNKLSTTTFDLNRNGLTAQVLHNWLRTVTPAHFDLHTPFNPLPFIMIPLTIVTFAYILYTAWSFVLPVVQSRIVWGALSMLLILTFTSGYMWNKIKNAPYIAMEGDQMRWIAAGYQNQLGLESQVVAGMYGLLGFTIIALTIFVPAQSSPSKQRIGVYLWLGMLVVVFSLLMKLFAVKNAGYPFRLLF